MPRPPPSHRAPASEPEPATARPPAPGKRSLTDLVAAAMAAGGDAVEAGLGALAQGAGGAGQGSFIPPVDQLSAWAASHDQRVHADAGDNPWLRVIAEETDEELADEVEFLLEQHQAGDLSEAEVLALAARKELEHEIEMQHRVNLTNERAGLLPWDREIGTDGGKIGWSEEELRELQATLGELPEDHVAGNRMLQEIRREDMSFKDEWRDEARVGGDHAHGLIRFYDVGGAEDFRHTGDERELGDPAAKEALGPDITRREEVLVHEVGHDIHDRNPEAFAAFQQAAGWQTDIDEDDLRARGVGDDELEGMEEEGEEVALAGTVYHHAYGELAGFDQDRIPQGDSWSYARTNPMDHFAETYMKAVLVPHQLAEDLLDAPARRVEAAVVARDLAAAALATAEANLAALAACAPPAPAPDRLAAWQRRLRCLLDLAMRQGELDEARADQAGLAEQHRIMREDIFHTHEAAAAAGAELAARGLDPEDLAEFAARAARLATPEQVERLAAIFR